MVEVQRVILGAIISSVVWFVLGGALYMNPLVAGIYKDEENSPALKKWPHIPTYLGLQYVGILIQCLLWAFVFALVKSALPEEVLVKGLLFGFILITVKIFPRFYDMWVQSTYPNKLLTVEFINGVIGSIIIALVFAYMI